MKYGEANKFCKVRNLNNKNRIMPLKTVFVDHNNNEMELYLNEERDLFINVGVIGEDAPYYSGYITLDKKDVGDLIKKLVELEAEM